MAPTTQQTEVAVRAAAARLAAADTALATTTRQAGQHLTTLWEAEAPAVRARCEVALDRWEREGGIPDLFGSWERRRSERLWTRVWAWLLRPEGDHGLEEAFLGAFLARCGVPEVRLPRPGEAWEVIREQRWATPGLPDKDTEPDLVILGPWVVVVVEHKTDQDNTSVDQYPRLKALVDRGPWREREVRRLVLLRTGPTRETDADHDEFDGVLARPELLELLGELRGEGSLWSQRIVALLRVSLARDGRSADGRATARRLRRQLDREALAVQLLATLSLLEDLLE